MHNVNTIGAGEESEFSPISMYKGKKYGLLLAAGKILLLYLLIYDSLFTCYIFVFLLSSFGRFCTTCTELNSAPNLSTSILSLLLHSTISAISFIF